MLKKFIRYYKPHKKLFVLDMLASLMISLIGMLYPIITRKLLNDFIPNQKIKWIIICSVSLLVAYLIRMGLKYFVQYYGHLIGVRIQATMRHEMFEHLEALPFGYFDEHETGEIMSRMTNDLMDISELAHHGPENFFISGVMIIASFIYLCFINPYLTLIIFACIPILIAIAIPLRKKENKAFMESRKSIAKINASLESSISGIRVTKAFTNSQKELEKFEIGNQEFVKHRCDAYKAMGIFNSTTSFVTDFFNVVVLLAGGLFLYYGKINFADYSAFIVSVNLFISPVTQLINYMEQFENGSTGFKRYIQIMESPEELEKPNAIQNISLTGKIKFEDVSFSYETKSDVLNHVSFDIEKGDKIALVGPSGGGKTTICHLIPLFYHPTDGKILLDDIDANDISYAALRKNIGIVQQDVFLFGGTVYDNILYGRLDATEEEVIEAAKKANIHEYIMSLPHGYQTEVGERGVKLSGGQKQRISIARVFLKNPSILILDEATSALDNATEINIQESLDELCKDRTTLVVAHRLSTIRSSKKIFVIENGTIVEGGSHEELLEKKGIYAKLYSLQFHNLSLEEERYLE